VHRIRSVANRVFAAERSISEPQAQETPLSDLLLMMDRVIAEKRLEHQCKIALDVEALASDAPNSVLLEPSTFCSILSNLINNAFEASAGVSEFEILVQVSTSQTLCGLNVVVQDRGCGIPSDLISRLGSERVTFGKVEGNGIGLLMARRHLESWGGTLTLSSEVGRGARVCLGLISGGSH